MYRGGSIGDGCRRHVQSGYRLPTEEEWSMRRLEAMAVQGFRVFRIRYDR